MAEVLASASAAAGIVSLGLQVCKGLASYYQAYRSYDSSLDHVCTRNSHILHVLRILEAKLPLYTSFEADIRDEINRTLQSCTLALHRLKEIEAICRKVRTPSTRLDKPRAVFDKALYPFRKKTICSISKELSELEQSLALAISALELDVLHAHGESLQKIELQSELGHKELQELNNKYEIGNRLLGTYGESLRSVDNQAKLQSRSLQAVEQNISNTGNASLAAIASLERTVRERTLGEDILAKLQQHSMEVIKLRIASEMDQQKLSNIDREVRSLQLALVHKPDLQRAVCERMTTLSHTQHSAELKQYTQGNASTPKNSPNMSKRQCTCSGYNRYKALRRRGSNLAVFYATTHSKRCPLWEQGVTTRAFGLAITAMTALIAGTVEMSFLLKRGAGGISIGTNLTLQCQVHVNSPAFAVAEKVRRILWNRHLSASEFLNNMNSATAEFREIFASRKALPYETDKNGDTLLTSIAHGLAYFGKCFHRALPKEEVIEAFFLALAELGVPANHRVSERFSQDIGQ
ncbi:MAG: hypothetical protein M1820_010137 [Bogoriella megaspora]|nr:MAG: hypothetical protein M1820_010137 [Bogoriella megaspora]